MGQSPNERERVIFSGVVKSLADLRERPSFSQVFGYTLASRLLWFICGLVALFLVGWFVTRPTLSGVRDLFGPSANPGVILDALKELQRDQFDRFTRLFQLLILSGLVPLFTLLAGYAFGARERGERSQQDRKEEDDA